MPPVLALVNRPAAGGGRTLHFHLINEQQQRHSVSGTARELVAPQRSNDVNIDAVPPPQRLALEEKQNVAAEETVTCTELNENSSSSSSSVCVVAPSSSVVQSGPPVNEQPVAKEDMKQDEDEPQTEKDRQSDTKKSVEGPTSTAQSPKPQQMEDDDEEESSSSEGSSSAETEWFFELEVHEQCDVSLLDSFTDEGGGLSLDRQQSEVLGIEVEIDKSGTELEGLQDNNNNCSSGICSGNRVVTTDRTTTTPANHGLPAPIRRPTTAALNKQNRTTHSSMALKCGIPGYSLTSGVTTSEEPTSQSSSSSSDLTPTANCQAVPAAAEEAPSRLAASASYPEQSGNLNEGAVDDAPKSASVRNNNSVQANPTLQQQNVTLSTTTAAQPLKSVQFSSLARRAESSSSFGDALNYSFDEQLFPLKKTVQDAFSSLRSLSKIALPFASMGSITGFSSEDDEAPEKKSEARYKIGARSHVVIPEDEPEVGPMKTMNSGVTSSGMSSVAAASAGASRPEGSGRFRSRAISNSCRTISDSIEETSAGQCTTPSGQTSLASADKDSNPPSETDAARNYAAGVLERVQMYLKSSNPAGTTESAYVSRRSHRGGAQPSLSAIMTSVGEIDENEDDEESLSNHQLSPEVSVATMKEIRESASKLIGDPDVDYYKNLTLGAPSSSSLHDSEDLLSSPSPQVKDDAQAPARRTTEASRKESSVSSVAPPRKAIASKEAIPAAPGQEAANITAPSPDQSAVEVVGAMSCEGPTENAHKENVTPAPAPVHDLESTIIVGEDDNGIVRSQARVETEGHAKRHASGDSADMGDPLADRNDEMQPESSPNFDDNDVLEAQRKMPVSEMKARAVECRAIPPSADDDNRSHDEVSIELEQRPVARHRNSVTYTPWHESVRKDLASLKALRVVSPFVAAASAESSIASVESAERPIDETSLTGGDAPDPPTTNVQSDDATLNTKEDISLASKELENQSDPFNRGGRRHEAFGSDATAAPRSRRQSWWESITNAVMGQTSNDMEESLLDGVSSGWGSSTSDRRFQSAKLDAGVVPTVIGSARSLPRDCVQYTSLQESVGRDLMALRRMRLVAPYLLSSDESPESGVEQEQQHEDDREDELDLTKAPSSETGSPSGSFDVVGSRDESPFVSDESDSDSSVGEEEKKLFRDVSLTAHRSQWAWAFGSQESIHENDLSDSNNDDGNADENNNDEKKLIESVFMTAVRKTQWAWAFGAHLSSSEDLLDHESSDDGQSIAVPTSSKQDTGSSETAFDESDTDGVAELPVVDILETVPEVDGYIDRSETEAATLQDGRTRSYRIVATRLKSKSHISHSSMSSAISDTGKDTDEVTPLQQAWFEQIDADCTSGATVDAFARETLQDPSEQNVEPTISFSPCVPAAGSSEPVQTRAIPSFSFSDEPPKPPQVNNQARAIGKGKDALYSPRTRKRHLRKRRDLQKIVVDARLSAIMQARKKISDSQVYEDDDTAEPSSDPETVDRMNGQSQCGKAGRNQVAKLVISPHVARKARVRSLSSSKISQTISLKVKNLPGAGEATVGPADDASTKVLQLKKRRDMKKAKLDHQLLHIFEHRWQLAESTTDAVVAGAITPVPSSSGLYITREASLSTNADEEKTKPGAAPRAEAMYRSMRASFRVSLSNFHERRSKSTNLLVNDNKLPQAKPRSETTTTNGKVAQEPRSKSQDLSQSKVAARKAPLVTGRLRARPTRSSGMEEDSSRERLLVDESLFRHDSLGGVYPSMRDRVKKDMDSLRDLKLVVPLVDQLSPPPPPPKKNGDTKDEATFEVPADEAPPLSSYANNNDTLFRHGSLVGLEDDERPCVYPPMAERVRKDMDSLRDLKLVEPRIGRFTSSSFDLMDND